MKLVYSSPKVNLNFLITGKFNVMIGKSGSGKSYLTELADLFSRSHSSKIIKPKQIFTNLINIEPLIYQKHDSLFVIDEGFTKEQINRWVPMMEKSDNYYIFITRDGIAEVPYGVDNTFILTGTPKHYFMKPAYNKGLFTRSVDKFDKIIVEDKGLGFALAKAAIKGKIPIASAEGKDNLPYKIEDAFGNLLIVFDKCGIGKTFLKLLIFKRLRGCSLFDSVSLEYEILNSIFHDKFIPYTDSSICTSKSEEKYYEDQINTILYDNFGLTYDKNSDQLFNLFERGRAIISKDEFYLHEAGGKPGTVYLEFRKYGELNNLNLFK